MLFWSFSLADQLSNQLLIFLVGQKKIVPSQRQDFFLSPLLNFLSRLFLKIDHSLISRLDKKNQEITKKNVRSLRRDNFLLANQKQ